MGLPVLTEIFTISDPVVEARRKKWNRIGFAVTACGYLLVGCFLLHDALGLGYIDRVIADSPLLSRMMDMN